MPVKVGFIGTGGISVRHRENLAAMQDVSLVAFCDRDEERATQAAAQHGGRAYSDYRKMLETEDLDAIYICVPPFAHGQMELDCLAKGCHLFIEKPVALDIATAKKVADAVDRSSKLVAVGYHWRFSPYTEKARALLEDQPVSLVLGYWLGPMPGVQWWKQMNLSGGQMVEQCTHIVDLARYLVGEIESVQALAASDIMPKEIEGYDVYESTVVNVTYESGVIGQFASTNVLTTGGSRAALEIYGRRIVVTVSDRNLVFHEPHGRTTDYREGPPGGTLPISREDAAFIEAVKTSNPDLIRSTYRDAVKTLAVTLAVNESVKAAKPVKVADLLKG